MVYVLIFVLVRRVILLFPLKKTHGHFILNFSASTVFDAQSLGYRTILVEDASKGINEEDVANKIQLIKAQNGLVVNSSEVTKYFNQKFCY